MGYMNPIERMGYNKFAIQAKNKGVDGVLLVDSPPEESEEINSALIKNDLCQIFLASPTTEDKRLKKIIKYCVKLNKFKPGILNSDPFIIHYL